MAHCEVVAVPRRGREAVELRAAPAHEPLASCAFEWPPGWKVHTTDWQAPGRLQVGWLFGLTAAHGDALSVSVARFGMEVDALAFLKDHLGGAVVAGAQRVGWQGLSVGAIDEPSDGRAWRVVCSGPAVHVLEARGLGRRYLDRAAATLRSLSGYEPPAEPFVEAAVGPLRFLRPAAWTGAPDKAPHGHTRAHFRRHTNEGHLSGYLRVRVIDRRVHPGLNPAEAQTEVDQTILYPGLDLGAPVADAGPAGPTTMRTGTLDKRTVETRHGVRQVGPLLVHLDACFPGADRAPVTRLNGRRVFDVALWSLAAT